VAANLNHFFYDYIDAEILVPFMDTVAAIVEDLSHLASAAFSCGKGGFRLPKPFR
jgi:hypothetical protein